MNNTVSNKSGSFVHGPVVVPACKQENPISDAQAPASWYEPTPAKAVTLAVGLHCAMKPVAVPGVSLSRRLNPVPCLSAAAALSDVLEQQQTPTGIDLFSKTQRYWYMEPRYSERVRPWLRELTAQLNRGGAVDLWQMTRAAAGDDDSALEWIGALLQDSTGMHVRGLDNCVSQDLWAALQALAARGRDPMVTLYPGAASSVHDPDFHHFYGIALLARRLIQAGHDARDSQNAAYWLNLSYELTARVPHRASSLGSLGKFGMPREVTPELIRAAYDAIPSPIERDHMDDIYLGYAGARFAAGGQPLSREGFEAATISDAEKMTHFAFE